MIKLVIDPGHGGKDPGAVGNGLKEKDLSLHLCKLVAEKFSAYEVEVTLTRTGDIDLGLNVRVNIANNMQADYFCSIHINAGGGTGFESFTYTYSAADTENLRDIVHNIVAGYYKSAGFTDRGKKRANFAVLRDTEMPAVLLENLFVDNQNDAKKLKDATFLDGLAGVIADGLVNALGIPLKNQQSWDPAGEIAKLKAGGLINSDHQPGDPVMWGELVTVINRLMNATK